MLKRTQTLSILKRWLVFNSVGALGIVVQICTLAILVYGFGINYLPATLLAVEAAILHNFLWHEIWTWADRRKDCTHSTLTRLLCFQLANGTISLFGNLLLMGLFVELLSLHFLLANGLCIATCSILNFIAGDRIVYRSKRIKTNLRGWDIRPKNRCNAAQAFFLITFLFLCSAPTAEAAELKPETVKAWRSYVAVTEKRIEKELQSDKYFLNIDFQSKDDVTHERKCLREGKVTIKEMKSTGNESRETSVPGGLIHHWRGSIFITGVDLDFILSRVKNPESADMAQEDVLESRVLERFPDGLKLYLKLQRKKIVTVVYNTEHHIRFRHHGAKRASSSSVATKIAEVERLEGNMEREMPEGEDHGFLWRMNSYWRYEQTEGGVIVECESLTLSRTIPRPLGLMIRPIINRIARESLERTLESMRTRMKQASEAGKEKVDTASLD